MGTATLLWQFYKPVVGNKRGKTITQMLFYVMIVIMFEVGEGTIMKENKNSYDLRIGKRSFSVAMPALAVFQAKLLNAFSKRNTKVIGRYKDFNNFIPKHKGGL